MLKKLDQAFSKVEGFLSVVLFLAMVAIVCWSVICRYALKIPFLQSEEWLYHMGVPTDKIEALAKHHANTVPVMMPYITAFFMPRAAGDRPDVVPDGAVNFAFLGQFAETPRDTIFTTEYSMRTGMEAVYTLLGVDRGVPEVWGSVYDVRNLLNATVKLRDGAPVTDMKLNFIEKAVVKKVLKKLDGTDIATLLREYRVI